MTELTQLSGPYVNPVLMKEVSVNGSLYLRSVITPNCPFWGYRQLCGEHKTCNFNFLEQKPGTILFCYHYPRFDQTIDSDSNNNYLYL